MDYQIRHAAMADFQRIQEIYCIARQFMQITGNPNQWGKHHPPEDLLLEDIRKKALYVITDGHIIRGVFYFCMEEDPTYFTIEDGSWRKDTPYGVIHRIAGDGSGGILQAAVLFAWDQIQHLRMDTHHDNIVMQKALTKQGFSRRGIIYLEDRSPRIAYDRIKE